MSVKKERIKVFDMTCTSCESKVENSIRKLNGVLYTKANFSGQFADVEFDTEYCSISQLKAAVKAAGYSIEKSGDSTILGLVAIGVAIIFLGNSVQGFDMNSQLSNASYIMLFIVGLFTSIHCVGMCGGIMLSQSVNSASEKSSDKFNAIKPALLYNLGRVVSYTILGGIVGAIGSVISLSLQIQAGIQIFAAVFMIIMGLNMSGVSLFRNIHIKLPWSPCAIKRKSSTPFVVGLANGFMPCGPLQTMQLYALGTSSALLGALSMFIFSLGTVPLMLTFGALSGMLSKGYSKKLLKLSGVFIIVLGVIMGRRGLALAGINMPTMAAVQRQAPRTSDNTAILEDGYQVIKITADGRGYSPNVLYIQSNLPVKWIIDGKQLNSCNNEIIVPSLDIKHKLSSGENIIEFTPKDSDISFSCWMGMIRGVFRVVDDLNAIEPSVENEDFLPPGGGGCCGTGPDRESIYGDDLSIVPAELLVKKAEINADNQSFIISGIADEFDPLILVVNRDLQAKIKIDVSEFFGSIGEFEIMDGRSGDILISFSAETEFVGFEYTFTENGGYGIIKDGVIYGIIEVVDDVKAASEEEIKSRYIK
jgi:sulfite exporter TauE/SafE/plastocyanin domain-containing protein/copper chaperone CopZ